MAVSSLVVGGIGPGSTIPLLLTMGLGIGAAAAPVVVAGRAGKRKYLSHAGQLIEVSSEAEALEILDRIKPRRKRKRKKRPAELVSQALDTGQEQVQNQPYRHAISFDDLSIAIRSNAALQNELVQRSIAEQMAIRRALEDEDDSDVIALLLRLL